MKKEKIISFHEVHKLIQNFPNDFLLVLRTINLLAMRNAALGGKTRDRLLLMTDVLFEVSYTNFLVRYFNIFKFRLKLFIYENY